MTQLEKEATALAVRYKGKWDDATGGSVGFARMSWRPLIRSVWRELGQPAEDLTDDLINEIAALCGPIE